MLDVACGLGIDYIGIKKNNISYDNDTFDIVYGRHILEHLHGYEKGLNEMLRIAKREVMIIFFKKPKDRHDHLIRYKKLQGQKVFDNIYSRQLFLKYLSDNSLVKNFENIDLGKEEIFRIYL